MRTQLGCTVCDDGFFVSGQACEACQGSIAHCTACRSGDECGACADGFVWTDETCTSFENIAHCTAAVDSKFTKCAFWHRPAPDGTACEGHAVWLVVLLIVLVCVLVLVGLSPSSSPPSTGR